MLATPSQLAADKPRPGCNYAKEVSGRENAANEFHKKNG